MAGGSRGDENQSSCSNQSSSSRADAAAAATKAEIGRKTAISPQAKVNAINLDESIMLDPRKIHFDSYIEDEYEVDDF